MALPLLKLMIEADITTETDVNPDVRQFFYEYNSEHRVNDAAVVPADAFVDDEDNQVVGNLPVVSEDEGYYLLFINGVLQPYMLYELEEDGSEFILNDASDILEGSPCTLIVTEFDPTSTSGAIIKT